MPSAESVRFDAGPLGRVALMVLLTLAVIAHVSEIHSRGFDPDELEHLHAAWLVSLGDVPYRDFFEHHSPGLYYAARPLFAIHHQDVAILWAARTCIWLCSMGVLGLTGLLAVRIGGRGLALPAMTLLAWSTVFHWKGIEFRPDVPATLLLLGAVLAWKPSASLWRVMFAGVLAGLATLFTQKSIVPAAGLWLGQLIAQRISSSNDNSEGIVSQVKSGSLWRSIPATLCFALGGALPWIVTFLLFARVGAAGDLWRGAIYQLWVWPLRGNRLAMFRSVAIADLGLYLAALCEIVCVTWRLFRRRDDRPGPDLVVLAVASVWCLLSLLWVKAVYPQFFFLWQPLLAVLAVRRLTDWCECRDDVRFVLAVGVPALGLAVLQLLLWKRAVMWGNVGALASLAQWLDRLDQVMPWSLLLILATVLFAASQGHRRKAILLLVVIAQFFGLLRIADAIVWPNAGQLALMQAVHEHVPPQGRVLDGFTGYAALRRHALYYWWINDYSRALMERFGDDRLLLQQLQSQPPDAVLFDDELRKLPPEVVKWLEQNYEESEQQRLLWLPKKKRQRSERAE